MQTFSSCLLLKSKKIFPTFAAINSRIMKEVNTAYLTCPIRNVIDRFGDKWSLLVLYHLHKGGTLRFGQIYKEMSDVSEKMLSATLKNLERDGLVKAQGLSGDTAACRVFPHAAR